jgi:hypothetical protein
VGLNWSFFLFYGGFTIIVLVLFASGFICMEFERCVCGGRLAPGMPTSGVRGCSCCARGTQNGGLKRGCAGEGFIWIGARRFFVCFFVFPKNSSTMSMIGWDGSQYPLCAHFSARFLVSRLFFHCALKPRPPRDASSSLGLVHLVIPR